jgi:hypothetical protein
LVIARTSWYQDGTTCTAYAVVYRSVLCTLWNVSTLITTNTDDSGVWFSTAYVKDKRGRGWNVHVIWDTQGGKRLEPQSVAVMSTERPVTAEVIRQLPIGTLLVEMRGEIAARITRVAKGPWEVGTAVWGGVMPTDHPEERQQLLDQASAYGVQRGKRLSADLLQIVAETYREAWNAGLPTASAVAERFGCSLSTAGKRIMAARTAGLLDGVGRGKS